MRWDWHPEEAPLTCYPGIKFGSKYPRRHHRFSVRRSEIICAVLSSSVPCIPFPLITQLRTMATSAAAPSLTPSQLATIDENRGSSVIAVSAFFVILCTLSVGLRFVARATRRMGFGIDDYLSLGALVSRIDLPNFSTPDSVINVD